MLWGNMILTTKILSAILFGKPVKYGKAIEKKLSNNRVKKKLLATLMEFDLTFHNRIPATIPNISKY